MTVVFLEVVVVAVLVLGPPALLVLRARKRVRADLLGEWEAGSAVEVPSSQRPAVQVYLTRWVQDHALGGGLGWVIGSLSPVASGPFAGLVLGHAAASVVGELVAQRQLATDASDGSDRLEHFVPAAPIWGLRTLGGAALVVAVVDARSSGGGSSPGVLVGAMAVALGCASVEGLTRNLVRRRGLGRQEIDAALRTAAARRLIGAGLGAALVGLALVTLSAWSDPEEPLRVWAVLALLVAVVGAPWALLRFPQLVFRRGRARRAPQRLSLWRSRRARPAAGPADAANEGGVSPGGS